LQVKLTDLMLGYVSSAIQQRVEIIYFHDAWLALITSRTEYIFYTLQYLKSAIDISYKRHKGSAFLVVQMHHRLFLMLANSVITYS